MVRFELYLPVRQLKALGAKAKEENVSKAELIRRAVEEFLKRERK